MSEERYYRRTKAAIMNDDRVLDIADEADREIAAKDQRIKELEEALKDVLHDGGIGECYCVPERVEPCGYCKATYVLPDRG